MVATQDSITELVARRQWELLREAVLPLHPSDVADIIIEHPTDTEGIIFRLLPKEKAGRVFSYLPAVEQRQLLEALPNEQVRRLLDELTPMTAPGCSRRCRPRSRGSCCCSSSHASSSPRGSCWAIPKTL